MIWYIGPESTVYHLYRDCRLLNNPYRYWAIDSAESPEEIHQRRWTQRRVCKLCAKRAS